MLATLMIFLGGAAGGLARFWLAAVIDARHRGRLPLGTLAVNLSGAAAIGLLVSLSLPPALHAALFTGLLGSYTTVSSFSLQTVQLLRRGRAMAAFGYAALSLAGCLAGAAGGLALGGVLWG